jgi:hypothetical protein
MEGATAIAVWHLNEARRIIRANKNTEDVLHAELLVDWLQRQEEPVTPRDILHRGPNTLRDKKKRDTALRLLFEANQVFEHKDGKTVQLLVNPKLTVAR